MKKIFALTDNKKHEDRVAEAIKNNIRKYIKREKKKELTDKANTYWDFDCKIGANKEDAKSVEYDNLIKELDKIKATNVKEVYVEIVAKIMDKPIKEDSLASQELE